MDTDDTELPTEWVALFVRHQQGWCRIDASHFHGLDAAVTQYLESGETRDQLLHLTTLDGDKLVVRASAVEAWSTNTPEGRRRFEELDVASDAERKATRAELGVFDEGG